MNKTQGSAATGDHYMMTRFHWRRACLPLLLLCAAACSDTTAPSMSGVASTADSSSATAPAVSSAELAALHERYTQLQAELQQVKDAQAIKRLQRSFGYYMEEGLIDEVVDLFADGATFEYARDGLYRGKERIRSYLLALNGGQQGLREGQLSESLQLMPVITLADDGQSAKARWRSIMLLGQHGGEALWGEGPYENEYVKENGVWKISKLHSYIGFYVDYDTGWNKGAVELPGTKENTTPDGAPTVQYGAFPEPFIPPYHYNNPVTGQ